MLAERASERLAGLPDDPARRLDRRRRPRRTSRSRRGRGCRDRGRRLRPRSRACRRGRGRGRTRRPEQFGDGAGDGGHGRQHSWVRVSALIVARGASVAVGIVPPALRPLRPAVMRRDTGPWARPVRSRRAAREGESECARRPAVARAQSRRLRTVHPRPDDPGIGRHGRHPPAARPRGRPSC